MRLDRKARNGLFATFAAGGALACGLLFTPGERLLIAKAKRVTSVDNGIDCPVLWRSDHNVLLMPYHADGDRFEYVELDTETGLRTPLEALNRKYRASLRSYTFKLPFGANPTRHIPPGSSISPDGKWLLFSEHGAKWSSPEINIATTLDAVTEIRLASTQSVYAPLWLHSARGWLETEGSADGTVTNGALLHDLGRPRRVERIPLVGAARFASLLGITSTERLLLMRSPGATPDSVLMADYSLKRGSGEPHRYSIRLPHGAVCQWVDISPRGDRLAWLLEYDYVPPLMQWLHRVWPSYRVRSEDRMGLWVSAVDGSHMIEIGHKPALPDTQRDHEVQCLQWLPGEKQISFIYKDALYTVAAP